jgi:hypothetical protein
MSPNMSWGWSTSQLTVEIENVSYEGVVGDERSPVRHDALTRSHNGKPKAELPPDCWKTE